MLKSSVPAPSKKSIDDFDKEKQNLYKRLIESSIETKFLDFESFDNEQDIYDFVEYFFDTDIGDSLKDIPHNNFFEQLRQMITKQTHFDTETKVRIFSNLINQCYKDINRLKKTYSHSGYLLDKVFNDPWPLSAEDYVTIENLLAEILSQKTHVEAILLNEFGEEEEEEEEEESEEESKDSTVGFGCLNLEAGQPIAQKYYLMSFDTVINSDLFYKLIRDLSKFESYLVLQSPENKTKLVEKFKNFLVCLKYVAPEIEIKFDKLYELIGKEKLTDSSIESIKVDLTEPKGAAPGIINYKLLNIKKWQELFKHPSFIEVETLREIHSKQKDAPPYIFRVNDINLDNLYKFKSALQPTKVMEVLKPKEPASDSLKTSKSALKSENLYYPSTSTPKPGIPPVASHTSPSHLDSSHQVDSTVIPTASAILKTSTRKPMSNNTVLEYKSKEEHSGLTRSTKLLSVPNIVLSKKSFADFNNDITALREKYDRKEISLETLHDKVTDIITSAEYFKATSLLKTLNQETEHGKYFTCLKCPSWLYQLIEDAGLDLNIFRLRHIEKRYEKDNLFPLLIFFKQNLSGYSEEYYKELMSRYFEIFFSTVITEFEKGCYKDSAIQKDFIQAIAQKLFENGYTELFLTKEKELTDLLNYIKNNFNFSQETKEILYQALISSFEKKPDYLTRCIPPSSSLKLLKKKYPKFYELLKQSSLNKLLLPLPKKFNKTQHESFNSFLSRLKLVMIAPNIIRMLISEIFKEGNVPENIFHAKKLLEIKEILDDDAYQIFLNAFISKFDTPKGLLYFCHTHAGADVLLEKILNDKEHLKKFFNAEENSIETLAKISDKFNLEAIVAALVKHKIITEEDKKLILRDTTTRLFIERKSVDKTTDVVKTTLQPNTILQPDVTNLASSSTYYPELTFPNPVETYEPCVSPYEPRTSSLHLGSSDQVDRATSPTASTTLEPTTLKPVSNNTLLKYNSKEEHSGLEISAKFRSFRKDKDDNRFIASLAKETITDFLFAIPLKNKQLDAQIYYRNFFISNLERMFENYISNNLQIAFDEVKNFSLSIKKLQNDFSEILLLFLNYHFKIPGDLSAYLRLKISDTETKTLKDFIVEAFKSGSKIKTEGAFHYFQLFKILLEEYEFSLENTKEEFAEKKFKPLKSKLLELNINEASILEIALSKNRQFFLKDDNLEALKKHLSSGMFDDIARHLLGDYKSAEAIYNGVIEKLKSETDPEKNIVFYIANSELLLEEFFKNNIENIHYLFKVNPNCKSLIIENLLKFGLCISDYLMDEIIKIRDTMNESALSRTILAPADEAPPPASNPDFSSIAETSVTFFPASSSLDSEAPPPASNPGFPPTDETSTTFFPASSSLDSETPPPASNPDFPSIPETPTTVYSAPPMVSSARSSASLYPNKPKKTELILDPQPVPDYLKCPYSGKLMSEPTILLFETKTKLKGGKGCNGICYDSKSLTKERIEQLKRQLNIPRTTKDKTLPVLPLKNYIEEWKKLNELQKSDKTGKLKNIMPGYDAKDGKQHTYIGFEDLITSELISKPLLLPTGDRILDESSVKKMIDSHEDKTSDCFKHPTQPKLVFNKADLIKCENITKCIKDWKTKVKNASSTPSPYTIS